MKKSKRKKTTPKRVLRLPDLDYAKPTVLNTLASSASKRAYDFGSAVTGIQILDQHSVATQDIAHSLVRNLMTQVAGAPSMRS